MKKPIFLDVESIVKQFREVMLAQEVSATESVRKLPDSDLREKQLEAVRLQASLLEFRLQAVRFQFDAINREVPVQLIPYVLGTVMGSVIFNASMNLPKLKQEEGVNMIFAGIERAMHLLSLVQDGGEIPEGSAIRHVDIPISSGGNA